MSCIPWKSFEFMSTDLPPVHILKWTSCTCFDPVYADDSGCDAWHPRQNPPFNSLQLEALVFSASSLVLRNSPKTPGPSGCGAVPLGGHLHRFSLWFICAISACGCTRWWHPAAAALRWLKPFIYLRLRHQVATHQSHVDIKRQSRKKLRQNTAMVGSECPGGSVGGAGQLFPSHHS